MMIHLKRNWPAKILSLLAAIVMWFFIMRDQNPVMEVTYEVPVQIQNLNTNYIADDPISAIRVTLSGPRDTIITMRAENLKAYIDASDVTPGQNNVTINFTPPTGMTVTDMRPNNVTLEVDEYAEKKVPVEIVPVGKLSDDVAITSLTIIPREVSVSGRKQSVTAVKRVIVKVNLDGQTQNFSSVGALEAWDANGNVLDVNISPSQAQAQYELTILRTEKAVPVTIQTTGTTPDGYALKTSTVSPTQITITGRPEAIKDITEIQTEPIDISNITSSSEDSYNLVFPTGVSSKITTVKVKVDIEKIEQ